MNNFNLSIILFSLFFSLGACSSDNPLFVADEVPFEMPEKAYVLAEQSRNAIVIRDVELQRNVWSWDPFTARIPSAHQSWFKNPSEVKPVFNHRYILMTASGGAVALIRISDSKLMFYANCGQNPHSAEILPDGNIVTAESRSGEINTFVVDTIKVLGNKSNTIKLGNAHNVVWDKKREFLYATGTIKDGVTALFRLQYNGERNNPKLIGQKRIYTFEKESGGHDLFPVYGEENKLWFTAASAVYQFDVSEEMPICENIFSLEDIKSISNKGDEVILLKPTEEWWAEGLINEKEEELFQMKSSRIYKGRWMVDNTFSYPESHDLTFTDN